MRARIRRAPDIAQAADAALSSNTQALASLVDNLLGTAAGSRFSQLWGAHIRYFYAYADGLAVNDAQALASARKGLVTSEAALGDFFAGASSGRLTPAAARAAMTTHVGHLLAQADAYAKGDYKTAAMAYTMGYEHGFAMGATLAGSLLPAAVGTQLQQPQWKLRSGVTQLLGEHVALVVAAMRAATGAAQDFRALGDSLSENTQRLASAVSTLYGDAAAARFQNLWADHVDALVLYTSSTVDGNTSGVSDAQGKLRAFEPALASFLSGATHSKLGAQALANAFFQHDQMLVDELAAYQAKDFSRAHQLSYQAYDQMYDLAAQLSNAISVTLGASLPKGGSQTGGGGMASVVSRR